LKLSSGVRQESSLGVDLKFDADTIFLADQKELADLLATRSYPHLRQIFTAFSTKYLQNVEGLISAKFSGLTKSTLSSMVSLIRNPASIAARMYADALRGWFTKQRIVQLTLWIQKSGIMAKVKWEYKRMYSASLYSRVKNRTRGDLRTLLLAVLGMEKQ
jgi:Annexin